MKTNWRKAAGLIVLFLIISRNIGLSFEAWELFIIGFAISMMSDERMELNITFNQEELEE